MLNSISRACIQQAVHAGSLYVTTRISVPGATLLTDMGSPSGKCRDKVQGLEKRNNSYLLGLNSWLSATACTIKFYPFGKKFEFSHF